MNWDPIKGGWDHLKSRAREAWGQAADKPGQWVAGTRERVAETLPAQCGELRDRVKRAVDEISSARLTARQPSMPNPLHGLAIAGLGAGLMYVFDPVQGRRRRALVRDQFVHALHELDDAIGVTFRDVSHRSSGLWAEARSLPARLSGEAVPDRVLEERVRAKLGRYVSHPGSIGVTVN